MTNYLNNKLLLRIIGMEEKFKVGQEVYFEHGLPYQIWVIDRITKTGKYRIRNADSEIEWADFEELKYVR